MELIIYIKKESEKNCHFLHRMAAAACGHDYEAHDFSGMIAGAAADGRRLCDGRPDTPGLCGAVTCPVPDVGTKYGILAWSLDANRGMGSGAAIRGGHLSGQAPTGKRRHRITNIAAAMLPSPLRRVPCGPWPGADARCDPVRVIIQAGIKKLRVAPWRAPLQGVR